MDGMVDKGTLAIKQLTQNQISKMDKQSKKLYFKSISQFQFLDQKRLGKGSFGQVRLALHLQTNKIYAVKIIDEKQMLSQATQNALQREIAIHSEIAHPHIIRLWQTLRQDSKVYMVMEYAERGNLFYFQNIKRVFTEEEASIFFTQTLSAVQYLHELNLVHRDIKPENLLLDKDQNIKICDLGWIVEGINQTHRTFCGTYEYMAPEMIFDRQYDHRIDIWALGVLLYELLHGYAPFQGETVAQVRESMLGGQISVDPQLSTEAQGLIFQILKVAPEERLACEEIRAHPWVIKMNKRRLTRLKLQHEQSFVLQKSSKNIRSPNTEQKQSPIHSFKPKKDHILQVSSKPELNENNRKKSNIKPKRSIEIERLSLKKLVKQLPKEKENIQKYLQSVQKDKKQKNWHKAQKSDICLTIKNPRLFTQINKSKKTRNDTIRFMTQIGETKDTIDSKLGIKKKQRKVKGPDLTVMQKKCHKTNTIRQSID